MINKKSRLRKIVVIVSALALSAILTLFVTEAKVSRVNANEINNRISVTETVTAPETTEANTVPDTTQTVPSEPVSDVIVKTNTQNQNKASVQTVSASKASSASTTKNEPKEERIFAVGNISVSAQNSKISDDKLRYCRSVIEGLPKNFFNWNVEKITFVDEIPGYGSNCNGLSAYSEKTIYLNVANASKALAKSAIYHEFGHYADVTYAGFTLRDCYSWSDEWTRACNAEIAGLYEYYPGVSSLPAEKQRMEAFAMVFDAYHTGRITAESVDLNKFPQMKSIVASFIGS